MYPRQTKHSVGYCESIPSVSLPFHSTPLDCLGLNQLVVLVETSTLSATSANQREGPTIRRHFFAMFPPLIARSETHLAIILELRLPPLDHVGGDVVPGQHGPSAADSGANHLAFVLWRCFYGGFRGGVISRSFRNLIRPAEFISPRAACCCRAGHRRHRIDVSEQKAKAGQFTKHREPPSWS